MVGHDEIMAAANTDPTHAQERIEACRFSVC